MCVRVPSALAFFFFFDIYIYIYVRIYIYIYIYICPNVNCHDDKMNYQCICTERCRVPQAVQRENYTGPLILFMAWGFAIYKVCYLLLHQPGSALLLDATKQSGQSRNWSTIGKSLRRTNKNHTSSYVHQIPPGWMQSGKFQNEHSCQGQGVSTTAPGLGASDALAMR